MVGTVRIRELARELEIKCSVLIECLPHLGVTETKIHSGSIDAGHADLFEHVSAFLLSKVPIT